jgi:hypothetical protein
VLLGADSPLARLLASFPRAGLAATTEMGMENPTSAQSCSMYPLPVMSARQPSASPGMISKDLTDGRISDIELKAKSYFTALYTNKDSTVLSDNIHVTYLPSDASTNILAEISKLRVAK